MKHIPNTITVLRSLGAVCLLLCNPAGTLFWAGKILAIKSFNQVSALIVCKRFCLPSPKSPLPTVFCSIVPIAIIDGIATFAAIQESRIITLSQE